MLIGIASPGPGAGGSASIHGPGPKERAKRQQDQGGDQHDQDGEDAVLPPVTGLEQAELARRVSRVDSGVIALGWPLRPETKAGLLSHGVSMMHVSSQPGHRRL